MHSLVFLHAAGRALFPSQCTPHPPSILSTTTMTTWTCDDARVDQQAMSPSTSSCMLPFSSSGSQPLSAPLLAYFLRLQTCLTSQEGSLDAQQMLDLALLLIIQEHGAEACAGLGQTKTNTDNLLNSGAAAQAAALLKKAASPPHSLPRAISALGTLYSFGWGVPKDDVRALQLFEEAAVAGDAEGMVELGLTLLDSASVENFHHRKERARALFADAFERGCPRAATALADLLRDNEDNDVDETLEVFRLYDEAARQGDAVAACNCAYLCGLEAQQKVSTGDSGKWKSAADYLQMAADRGLVRAKCNLASLLEHGLGCEPNAERAATLYAEAGSLFEALKVHGAPGGAQNGRGGTNVCFIE